MKFADKYPTMKPLFDERDNIIRGEYSGACFICGNQTEYIEINYEAFFCSDECVSEMDKRVKNWSEEHIKVQPMRHIRK